MPQIFPNGINGLSDSKFAGAPGSAYRLVGVDYRSTPGLTKVHQAMSLDSPTSGGNTLDEFCKVALAVSDGSTLWFSSESGKIWRENNGTWTLVHTTVPTSGDAGCTGAEEYEGYVYWATEDYLHRIFVDALGLTWADNVDQNYGEFQYGVRDHPMALQNLQLFVADGTTIGSVDASFGTTTLPSTSTVSFGAAVYGFMHSAQITPITGKEIFPQYIKTERGSGASAASLELTNFEVEPGYSRLLVVHASAWRTDTTFPATPTATYGGAAMTLLENYQGFGNGSGTERYQSAYFYIEDPGVGQANITVNWGGTQPNLVVHAYQFVAAGGIEIGQADGVTNETSESILTLQETVTENTDYHVRLITTRTTTTTHTYTDVEIDNDTNNNGRDSAAITDQGTYSFSPTSLFSVRAPEYISDIEPFDIDLLVGTKVDNNVNKARVLRWDTVNSSYSADDTVDDSGVNAFIRDDNYVYVSVGDYGRLYYYDGEKLEPLQRIPGDWSPTKKATIHRNAVGFHLGVPIFGLSNVTGNPQLQGVYSFGKYSRDYPITLSLDYPLATGTFSGLEVGAIVTQGADMWASWTDGTNKRVDKLDWSNKYDSAYIETGVLTGGDNRSNLKTLTETWIDYASLPSSTNVVMSYETKHNGFTALTSKNDTKLNQINANGNVPDTAALRLKFAFTVNGNDAPEVEGFGFNLSSRPKYTKR